MIALALSREQFNAPLVEEVLRRTPGMFAVVVQDRPIDTEWRLKEGECDLALVSPLAYSAQEGDFALVPNAGIAAVGPTGDLLLVFKPGLHHFETLAVRVADSLDAILAQIILREKYDMRPRVVVYKATAEQALRDFDCVLIRLHEDDSFIGSHVETVDLIDEWFDMTQLPYLRQVFVCWSPRITQGVCDELTASCGVVDADSIASVRSQLEGETFDDSFSLVPGHYRYSLDEEALEGLNRFFQLAYFHGLHRDIPAFTTWRPPEAV